VDNFSENVDLLPTLCEALSLDKPAQCDGQSLIPLMAGQSVPWRKAVHYEWDFRRDWVRQHGKGWTTDQVLSDQNLAVSVSDDVGYVQFGDGSFKCFDLKADATWRTECVDPERILAAVREQLVWRQEHLRRDFTDMLLSPQRRGRWPARFTEELSTRDLGRVAVQ
jgi:arylsulfatase A-like enzyme